MTTKQPTVLVFYESRTGRSPYDSAAEVLLTAQAGKNVRIERKGRWLMPSESNSLYAIKICLEELGYPYSIHDVAEMGFRQKLAAKMKPIPRLEVNGKVMSFNFGRTPSSEDIRKFYDSCSE